ncbi:54S ribosomal protein L6 mitochondrial [Coemansia erecta]|uniref:Large ribosomal subunit protein uL6m n=1 Tax=Coemansia asiatica TaxID=1052880 RepID=A0A9W7XPJ6_9FUNG|nr:54S ribosomal protein L6 mitochondrial [Coemansia asiatica]KAJ2843968.1 54S ribosomal protein L6 mitochondrial [Coemansia erecta]KAJ2888696.1 54S ribosomal protein L6 mitochondrial [Coemansia asiatica]
MNSAASRRLSFILSTRSLSTTACSRMSHIGSLPVKYASDVKIQHIDRPFSQTDSRFFDKTTLEVAGPLGTLKLAIEPFVKLDFSQTGEESSVLVSVADSQMKKQRQMWGTTRALINNCVVGVTEGFNATLRFVGVGYRAALEDGKLALRLGYSHPINMDIPEGLKVTVPVPTRVLISGLDLQQVKQFAAKVREWKKPEPYNQKGIFIDDETIRKKDGKKK